MYGSLQNASEMIIFRGRLGQLIIIGSGYPELSMGSIGRGEALDEPCHIGFDFTKKLSIFYSMVLSIAQSVVCWISNPFSIVSYCQVTNLNQNHYCSEICLNPDLTLDRWQSKML